jgi:GNAT superfamily N-acetyltransferase
MSIGMIKPWIEGLEYYIDEFCVSYNSQGKGYGSQFLELVDADIKSRGMNAIILNTSQDVPAYDFYLKNGFTADEELRILYR